ncbi:MAG: hypothetical protein CMI19_01310 [Opitutae bacterium]|nr:hypothetical protein [Opitutae bacterium]
MTKIVGFVTFLMVLGAASHAVPPVLNYSGQVAVNGEAFNGNGLFKFALVNADGTTTYWSNDGTSVDGSEPQASVSVPVIGGLYSILLGNTAQQGMGAIDPAVFAQHTGTKLRVWFSDGVNGFQQLSPDRPFASVPYAFSSESAKSAETAKTAEAANVAMAVQAGAITKQMLGNDVLTDINATIGMNRLSSEVTEKLNQEKTTNNYNAPSVGSLLAVPYGSDAPAGYSLYQRGEPKEFVWEEKAPVSVARYAYDGVEVLDDKIYFVGGYGANNYALNIAERYDPVTNNWETLSPMSVARRTVACSVLNGKLYAIGGHGLSSVEIYNPSTLAWTTGPSLPSEVKAGTAVTVNGKIYLIGGTNSSDQNINQVLCFDPSSNQWTAKASMPTARHGMKLVWFDNRIWAIGGNVGGAIKIVESYDPTTDTWKAEASLATARMWSVTWVTNGKIYVGGGQRIDSSIEVYDPTTKQWSDAGNLPEKKFCADAVVLNDQVYVVAGQTASGVYSNKVYAADLNASMEGVYDLYRKDGDAPVGTPIVQSEYADGSVTTAKLDGTILKYLKPEITSQPQAQKVYAKTNVSYSVTAEGKYLTYQWKKDEVDLAGETNATLNIKDANATQHDGNYSVVVSNDFGSEESGQILVDVNTTWSTDGLVGWWKFDEGSGTVAYDSSGNGNDGNLTNGPTWSIGKIGGALSFDGVDDFVFLGNPPEIGLSGNQSFSMWLKPFSFNARRNPYNKAYGGTGTFTLEPNQVMTYFYGVSGTDSGPYGAYQTTSLLALNEWSNLVLTRNLVTLKVRFFFNGLLDVTLNAEHTTASIDSLSAKIGDGYTSPFHGVIDDFRIYDRALSAEEVQALYNLGQ